VHSAPKTDHERGKKGMFTEHVRRGKTDSVDVKKNCKKQTCKSMLLVI